MTKCQWPRIDLAKGVASGVPNKTFKPEDKAKQGLRQIHTVFCELGSPTNQGRRRRFVSRRIP